MFFQNLQKALLALALVGLCAPAAFADSKARGVLIRTDASSDDGAKGRVEVKRGKNRERFRVKIDTDAALLTHDLYMDDGLGTQTFVAALSADDDDDGELSYRAQTRRGDGSLPLAVDSVKDLVGRAIEIRIGDQTVMTGTVPSFSERSRLKAKNELTATDLAPAEAEAKLKLETDSQHGDQRFEIEVEDFDLMPGQTLRVFVEDPENPGSLIDVGAMMSEDEEEDDSDELEYERRARHGDPLPLDVESVLELADLAIEIRDGATGDVYFEGVIPMPLSKESHGKREAESKLAPEEIAGADGEAEIEIKSRSDRSDDRFEVEVEGVMLAAGQELHVFIEDPDVPDTFVDVGTLASEEEEVEEADDDDDSLELELELKTKRGDELPLGVAAVVQLSGLRIEIRDPASDDLFFSGFVPSFE